MGIRDGIGAGGLEAENGGEGQSGNWDGNGGWNWNLAGLFPLPASPLCSPLPFRAGQEEQEPFPQADPGGFFGIFVISQYSIPFFFQALRGAGP